MHPRKGIPKTAVWRGAPLFIAALLAVVALLGTTMAGATRSQTGKEGSGADASQQLVGTWRLISWVNVDQDGNTTPLLQHPVGKLTYTSRGDQWVVLADRGAGGPDAKLWYSGTFDVHPRAHKVIHHVRFSSSKPYEGIDLVRHYKLRGDRLVLSFPVGTSSTSYVRWVRAR